MNERIKQFANLAREQTQVGTSFEQGLLAYSEKFAELIVKECLSMIENEASQYAEPVWAFELVNDIKDQFGVDE
jgi:hypothetical protein